MPRLPNSSPLSDRFTTLLAIKGFKIKFLKQAPVTNFRLTCLSANQMRKKGKRGERWARGMKKPRGRGGGGEERRKERRGCVREGKEKDFRNHEFLYLNFTG